MTPRLIEGDAHQTKNYTKRTVSRANDGRFVVLSPGSSETFLPPSAISGAKAFVGRLFTLVWLLACKVFELVQSTGISAVLHKWAVWMALCCRSSDSEEIKAKIHTPCFVKKVLAFGCIFHFPFFGEQWYFLCLTRIYVINHKCRQRLFSFIHWLLFFPFVWCIFLVSVWSVGWAVCAQFRSALCSWPLFRARQSVALSVVG